MRIDRIAACLLAFSSTPLVYSGVSCQIRAGDYWIIFRRKKKIGGTHTYKKIASEYWMNNNNDKSCSPFKKRPSAIGVSNTYYTYNSARSFHVLWSTEQTHSLQYENPLSYRQCYWVYISFFISFFHPVIWFRPFSFMESCRAFMSLCIHILLFIFLYPWRWLFPNYNTEITWECILTPLPTSPVIFQYNCIYQLLK